MFTFLLIVHALIAATLVTVILMQRSEGGGLGMGSGPAGLMTARGAADFLTRATGVLAALFVLMAFILAAIAATRNAGGSIDTSLAGQAPIGAITAPIKNSPIANIPMAGAPTPAAPDPLTAQALAPAAGGPPTRPAASAPADATPADAKAAHHGRTAAAADRKPVENGRASAEGGVSILGIGGATNGAATTRSVAPAATATAPAQAPALSAGSDTPH